MAHIFMFTLPLRGVNNTSNLTNNSTCLIKKGMIKVAIFLSGVLICLLIVIIILGLVALIVDFVALIIILIRIIKD